MTPFKSDFPGIQRRRLSTYRRRRLVTAGRRGTGGREVGGENVRRPSGCPVLRGQVERVHRRTANIRRLDDDGASVNDVVAMATSASAAAAG